MNTLIGAVSQHHAGALLSRALSHLPENPYFFGLAYNLADDIDVYRSNSYPQNTPTFNVGLACASLYKHNSSPILFRDRLTISLTGCIENTEALQNKLRSLGYEQVIKSHEELIATLIDWYDRVHKDLNMAFQLALSEAQGFFAVAAFKRARHDFLLCGSRGPSLYLGQGSDGSYFSTDPALIRERASLLIELKDGEFAELNSQHIACFNADGKAIKKDPVPAHAAGYFAHHMLADIETQPRVLAELVRHYQNDTLADYLTELGCGHQFERVLMLASGSSHHAATSARYWIEQIAGLPVQVEYGSEYRFLPNILQANTLLIAISQSGETADTIASLRHAIQLGHHHTLAITNQADSTLAKLAAHQIGQHAGKEIGATSTKTFTTQLMCLYFVALKLAQGKHISTASADRELQLLPRAVADTLKLSIPLKNWALQLAKVSNLFMVGRNAHFPIALEAAQKMKEVAYLHAEGYLGGELKHGPVTLIDRTVPVIACLPWDLMAEKTLANLQEVRARQGELFVLSDVGLSSSDGFNFIHMPQKLPHLNPILYTVAFQLLSYFTALTRGNNVDSPRNISKTIDIE
ncbi:isomerizing glutamine--fructose-6-phosphate transaminase [Chitinibacter bivalviorum]|uniref:Glutamine--fructose-6-phosphate aminotransferase [isomerizing] n=1 Tax=Chitinibacter bivalviorum TaxID=2739434 RepID=A0A7H9BG33_9NEIS|nr:isomerizing glutamine--fructose-6-phosphate transaminase [Chitinibacter bivalviorum]QLG87206.1 isomerizing glutamine--fructose-6-phosphate transaminase [Chitinibacter bivalviorum]